MKFINYLERITGVGIFPLISLLIFFLFFVVLLFLVFNTNKSYIRLMQSLPFSDNENE